MTAKYKAPNEQQVETIKAYGMDPKDFAVSFTSEDCFCLLHHKTGDEIMIRPNVLKKGRT